jgi:CheY-like chemotaxis protein
MAPKVVDLNRVVLDAEAMLRRLIGEDIVLTTVLQPGPAMVKIDPGQIEQAIFNLAINARDAMPQGGSLTVDVRQVVLTEDYHRAHPYSRPGRHVLLAVCDTGVGMTPEVKSRAFEPFFTTKEAGKGTGLGLASVFGIVKQSEGHVQLYSEPGVGTCIKIYLPAVDGAGELRVDLPREEPVRRGTETVLLVEDEEDVRRITVLALESFGYTVLHAGDGPAALDLAANHPGPIHLMVTDVIMPGLSGSETAARLRRMRPEARVLFMSGYIDDAVVRHGILAASEVYLQKPFTPLDFARKVREILDAH